MKLPIGLVCAVLILTVSVQPCYGSMAANPGPLPTLEVLSGQFRHVFIGEVVSKEVAETETHYTFNVSEWLMNSLNTSQVQWTEDGGSVIAVSPSTTLYAGIEYLVYFDNHNGTHVGIDRHFRLLNGIDDDDMAAFRYYLRALNAATTHVGTVSDSTNLTERAREPAGAGGVDAVIANYADTSPEEKVPVDLRPQALLVSWVLLQLILKKLLKK